MVSKINAEVGLAGCCYPPHPIPRLIAFNPGTVPREAREKAETPYPVGPLSGAEWMPAQQARFNKQSGTGR